MIFNREKLEMLTLKELKVFALENNIAPHTGVAETKEQLLDRIIFETAKEPDRKPNTEEKTQKQREANSEEQTIEDVKKACANYVKKGLKIYLHVEEETGRKSFMFRVKTKARRVRDMSTGSITIMDQWKEDSGTLSQPMKRIKQCAQILMQSVEVAVTKSKEFNEDGKLKEIA